MAAIFDPFGNAVHTALAFPVLGEDVLVVGAGPIGLMATAVARHAGRPLHRRQRAERVPPRARDARWAPPSSSTRASATSSDVQRELGMVEGFDVVFEMSGNAGALRDAIANMAHGAGMAILGIPTDEIAIDVSRVVFDQLTPARHLRPGDVRDLVQDVGDAPVGPRHLAGHHPPLSAIAEHEAAFAAARTGASGKVVMDWTA